MFHMSESNSHVIILRCIEWYISGYNFGDHWKPLAFVKIFQVEAGNLGSYGLSIYYVIRVGGSQLIAYSITEGGGWGGVINNYTLCYHV